MIRILKRYRHRRRHRRLTAALVQAILHLPVGEQLRCARTGAVYFHEVRELRISRIHYLTRRAPTGDETLASTRSYGLRERFNGGARATDLYADGREPSAGTTVDELEMVLGELLEAVTVEADNE